MKKAYRIQNPTKKMKNISKYEKQKNFASESAQKSENSLVFYSKTPKSVCFLS